MESDGRSRKCFLTCTIKPERDAARTEGKKEKKGGNKGEEEEGVRPRTKYPVCATASYRNMFH